MHKSARNENQKAITCPRRSSRTVIRAGGIGLGVHIGRPAVIGTDAVVTRGVASGTVIGSVPARVLHATLN